MSMARDVGTIGAATLTSRLLGFLRDAGVAAVLGAGAVSDAYLAALQVPNLFRRLLAEGALNSAYVPLSIRIRDEQGSAATRQFAEDVLGTMAASLCLVASACAVFAPAVVHILAPGFGDEGDRFRLAVDFVRLAVPYVAVAGMVAVAAAALNAEGRVAAVGFGIVAFNTVLLIAVAAALLWGMEATAAAAAMLSAATAVAGVAQLVCVGLAWRRLGAAPRRVSFGLSPAVRRFFVQAGPGVLAGGVPQLKLMAGAMVASSSPAAVSWLYYANRLYELPLGVIAVAIASVLGPAIAAGLRRGDRDAAAAQSRAFELALGLSLPSAVAFAVLAAAIAGALFQRGAFGPQDTAMVAAALAAIAAGLPGHSLEKMLGAVSFAHEDTRTPMLAALGGLATAVTAAVLLFPRYGHVGIAAAIALSGWVGATVLAAVTWRRGWLRIERAAWRRVPGMVAATIVMGAVLATGTAVLVPPPEVPESAVVRIAVLAMLVMVGLATYLATLQALGVASLRTLVEAVRRPG